MFVRQKDFFQACLFFLSEYNSQQQRTSNTEEPDKFSSMFAITSSNLILKKDNFEKCFKNYFKIWLLFLIL